MVVSPIYEPRDGEKMRVACFVSGSGTNARRIIERSLKPDSRYRVALVFSDVRDDRTRKGGGKRCRARDIAKEYGVSYECEDIRDFYKGKGHKTRRDLSIRPEFDRRVLSKLEPINIDVIANAGYMSIMTEPILDAYAGRIFNVHPADLTLIEGDDRRYVGIHVVRDAILAGEGELRATTHVVREKIDHGEILVLSEPVAVELPVPLEELGDDEALLERVVDVHQDRLKRRGDWVIYPLTLQMVAEGRFALDGEGNVYLDGEPAPGGFRL